MTGLSDSDRQEARRALARCGVRQEHALQAVATLSGGEQARVSLCLLTLRPCNFLLLDEPTNHLDRAAKESLPGRWTGSQARCFWCPTRWTSTGLGRSAWWNRGKGDSIFPPVVK